jgi:flagellar L-ring protein precursor FlgH
MKMLGKKTWIPACAGMTAVKVAAMAALLTGCAATPTSIVKGPTSVRPMIADAGTPSEGAIYNAAPSVRCSRTAARATSATS